MTAADLDRLTSRIRQACVDAEIARHLARAGAAATEAAGDVQSRLREHVELLLDPARAYLDLLGDDRHRDVAVADLRRAGHVLTAPVRNPAAHLLLLASSAESLARYSRVTIRRAEAAARR
ncbi:hypothetical protein [Streptomyces kanasensis]|uniref:hypothetical protein n=1 Tax=Streptomyces kanasensis TaxID=936756 RepID=UPI00382E3F71